MGFTLPDVDPQPPSQHRTGRDKNEIPGRAQLQQSTDSPDKRQGNAVGKGTHFTTNDGAATTQTEKK